VELQGGAESPDEGSDSACHGAVESKQGKWQEKALTQWFHPG